MRHESHGFFAMSFPSASLPGTDWRVPKPDLYIIPRHATKITALIHRAPPVEDRGITLCPSQSTSFQVIHVVNAIHLPLSRVRSSSPGLLLVVAGLPFEGAGMLPSWQPPSVSFRRNNPAVPLGSPVRGTYKFQFAPPTRPAFSAEETTRECSTSSTGRHGVGRHRRGSLCGPNAITNPSGAVPRPVESVQTIEDTRDECSCPFYPLRLHGPAWHVGLYSGEELRSAFALPALARPKYHWAREVHCPAFAASCLPATRRNVFFLLFNKGRLAPARDGAKGQPSAPSRNGQWNEEELGRRSPLVFRNPRSQPSSPTCTTAERTLYVEPHKCIEGERVSRSI